MQDHIRVGREYPTSTTTRRTPSASTTRSSSCVRPDDAGAFLDLVQRLRGTEASSFTLRDTPSFTCIAASVERALNALDGGAIPVLEPAAT